MDKVNAQMVRLAEGEFYAYCKKHGDRGKVQVALENAWLELKKAYAIRKEAIRQRFLNENVVKFYEMDNYDSYAAFNMLNNRVWELVADVVIAYEDGNEDDIEEAVHFAAQEERIKLEKLVALLK
jgi:hypothetical protein